ncbi:hypothetical protein COOONC_18814 [Cooperia oncophora]
MINRQITELHDRNDEDVREEDIHEDTAEIVNVSGHITEPNHRADMDSSLGADNQTFSNSPKDYITTELEAFAAAMSREPRLLPLSSDNTPQAFRNTYGREVFSQRPGSREDSNNPFDHANSSFPRIAQQKRDGLVLTLDEQVHYKLAEGCSHTR